MLCDLLKIEKGITCIIGSGGKTTMLSVLAGELSRRGTVIVTTSTHIFPFDGMPTGRTEQEVAALLEGANPVCAGTPAEHGKLTAPEVPFERLAELADYVLVEADGSKHLPMKAHKTHEPVLPEHRGLTICVVGASGFGDPICESAHRADVFGKLCRCAETEIITPERVAAVITKENLCDLVFVNQVHTVEEYQLAYQLAQKLDRPTYGGSLQKGMYQCLS